MDLSQKAADKIRSLGREWICLSLVKGGCAEYKYIFSFTKPEQHYFFSFDDLQVFVPFDQVNELQEAKIDYKSDLVSSEFFVSENEYFSRNCGCGISVG